MRQEANADDSAGKQQVLSALNQVGASKANEALILAMGEQETNNFTPSEHDSSKDGTSSANYSEFNLNPGELQKLGYTGDPNALNEQSNQGEVAQLLNHGIQTLGADAVMNMTRDGVDAEYQNNSLLQSWRSGQVQTAQYILDNPSAMTDNSRQWTDANYI